MPDKPRPRMCAGPIEEIARPDTDRLECLGYAFIHNPDRKREYNQKVAWSYIILETLYGNEKIKRILPKSKVNPNGNMWYPTGDLEIINYLL